MGKFVIGKTNNGQYRFNLKAGNGEIIATSESYTTFAACKNGVESVKKNAFAEIEDQTLEENKKNPKYELYLDKAGEYRFRLKAANGEPICHGEGYKAKASCKNGIESIGRNAPDAEVVVVEE